MGLTWAPLPAPFFSFSQKGASASVTADDRQPGFDNIAGAAFLYLYVLGQVVQSKAGEQETEALSSLAVVYLMLCVL